MNLAAFMNDTLWIVAYCGYLVCLSGRAHSAADLHNVQQHHKGCMHGSKNTV